MKDYVMDTQPDGEELRGYVQAYKEGNSEAFGHIYDALYAKAYSYALKRTGDSSASEDIVANSFYHMLTHLSSFTWQDAARFYGWMFRIIMNEIATYYRQNSRVILREDWLDIESEDEDESQLDTLIHDEATKDLRTQLGQLPMKLSRVIELYYFAGLSHAEIAQSLKISEGAARVRLHRGVQILHKNMQGERHAYRG